MASIDVNTNINAPDEITINLVREDYLDTSNTFRLVFEICLSITCAIIGNLISYSKIQDIPTLNWVFLFIMVLGCIAFLLLAVKNYNKAKSKVAQK